MLLVAFACSSVRGQCTLPPVGLWLLQAYEPTIQFKYPTLAGYLKLEIDENNSEVYIGIEPSIRDDSQTTNSVFLGNAYVQMGTIPAEVGFVLTGVFDQDTCALYGTYIFSPTMVHDTIQWSYDGNGTMAGLYRPFLAGIPQFPKHSMHVLQFQGPIST